MTEPHFTICTECANFHNEEPHSPRKDCGYNHKCHAIERPLGRDPYNGKPSYYAKNDLGQVYFGADKYVDCRSVNPDGNCQHWKALGR